MCRGPISGGLLTVSAPGWSHRPVLAAVAMSHRRQGLRPLAMGWGLLVAGRSVHGRGMAEPLTVVGLDAGGGVTGSAGSFRAGGSRWPLRLPSSSCRPA